MSLILRTEKDYGSWKLELSIKFEYLVSTERLDNLHRLIDSVLDGETASFQDIRQMYDVLGHIEKVIEKCKEEELKDFSESFKSRIVTYEYSYLKVKAYVEGELNRVITITPK